MNALRRVAVTGAAGLVGRAVLRALTRSGNEALAVVRRAGTSHASESAIADLFDCDGLARAFEGCDAVVHAAALMKGPDDLVEATNVQGTANVLRAARVASVQRVVHVSTVAVYGGGDLVGVEESRRPDPGDAYGRSKLRAEELVARSAASRAPDAWILRPCTLYGPDDGNLTAWLLGILEEGWFPLPRGGRTLFDLLSVDDLAEACLLAAFSEEDGRGRVLNVGPRVPLDLDQLVRRARERLGVPARTIGVPDPTRPPDGVSAELLAQVLEHRSFVVERARACLGFEAARLFPEGL